MKLYKKTINGVSVIKTLKQITVNKNGMTTYNPSESMILEDGWEEYIIPIHVPTDDELLQAAKENKRNEIAEYDSSTAVNSFSINGYETWIDKATRVGLKLRFDAELSAGLEKTTLWQNGINFSLPLVGDNNAFDLLNAIELYASKCYDNTQEHYAVLNLLSSLTEVEAYDYTNGYPEKLNF